MNPLSAAEQLPALFEQLAVPENVGAEALAL
jgi:hypothetical protein